MSLGTVVDDEDMKRAALDTEVADIKVKDLKRSEGRRTAGDQSAAVNTALAQNDSNMGLQATEEGVGFTESKVKDGVEAISRASFSDDPRSGVSQISLALDAIVKNSRNNPEILNSANRLAATAVPVMEREVQNGAFEKRGSQYVVNAFSRFSRQQKGSARGVLAGSTDEIDSSPMTRIKLADTMFELNMALTNAGIQPSFEVRTPTPDEASEQFRAALREKGLGGAAGMAITAKDLAVLVHNLSIYAYGVDGEIPRDAAETILQSINGGANGEKRRFTNMMREIPALNYAWTKLERDLKKALKQ